MKLRPYLDQTMWDISHDPWGSCLSALGPILDVLYVRGGDIPASAGYRPATALHGEADLVYDEVTGENDLAAELLRLLDNGQVDIADLEHASRVLDRYADLVRLAGQDY
jgi:hypothetical protein